MPKGLMIAIGLPKRPGASGKMPEPPEPIGGGKPKMEAEEPEEQEEQPKPKGAWGISPDALSFRSAEEVCGNCVHMQKDGVCDGFGMEVAAGDSCNAFNERESGLDDEAGETEAEELREHGGVRGEMGSE